MRPHCRAVSAVSAYKALPEKAEGYLYPPDLLPEPLRTLYIPIYELLVWVYEWKTGTVMRP